MPATPGFWDGYLGLTHVGIAIAAVGGGQSDVVGSLGNDLGARNVVWVDYDAGISLHRVVSSNPKEQRLQRLATSSTRDKRISYGCINVPVAFYDRVVEPTFTGTSGVIYILPEVRSMQAVFPAYDADKAGN